MSQPTNLDGAAVLVTGAGGFIGSHLVECLLGEGARVRAVVRYNSRASIGNLAHLSPELLQRVELVQADLRDPSAMLDAATGSDIIFHLGASISIPYSYLHPREVVETNVTGTLNVLEAARRCKARCLVHTSSSEVYGTAQAVPMSEAHRLQGQSPYSASKIAADKLAESYARAFDLPVVTLRPFNTYGPRQSTRAVIPTIITQTLAGQKLKLGALEPTRDFTFVSDTVAAFLLAATRPGAQGREINAGSGQEISIGALVNKIFGLLGREVPLEHDNRRDRPAASEVERLCADATLAKDLLGWAPRVSLTSGLEATIQWLRDNHSPDTAGSYRV